uniref:Orn/DAP/Arg decarboxylase 2 N-terminal domain-containing protein n=1 Tax=Leptobrachium leishanense TaxID=445787 RepID=A0A8C5M2L7_9ANUR
MFTSFSSTVFTRNFVALFHQNKVTMDYIQESDFTMMEEGFTVRDLIDKIINEASQTEERDAFLVGDMEEVVKKHLHFLKTLPRVKPFYAVKCNNVKPLVKILAEMGSGFDCASKAEIELIKEIGVNPERIIYANTCKQISSIKFAANSGVQMMTFDNELELVKVSENHPKAKMVLRIANKDSNSSNDMNAKFGAPLNTCRHLLETAKNLNIEVIGVSFHVGIGCLDPQIYAQSIADAHLVFNMASEFQHKMTLLDIGGGFPGTVEAKISFEEIAAVVNSALDTYFPEGSAVDVIAEPGRYYVLSAFTLAVNIIAKKIVQQDAPESHGERNNPCKSAFYYLNDGIYGTFSRLLFLCGYPKLIFHKEPSPEQPLYMSSLWGPTCDPMDQIAEHLYLPELCIGDWLLYYNVGAYTIVTSSTFNGFHPPHIHFAMSPKAWEDVLLLKRRFEQA